MWASWRAATNFPSWTTRAQLHPSNRIFRLSKSRIPDDNRGDTISSDTANCIPLLVLFKPQRAAFLHVPELHQFSVCSGRGHGGVRGSFCCSFGFRGSLPSLRSSVWMPGDFHLPWWIRQRGEERSCHWQHRCFMWSKITVNLKMGMCVKGCGGRAGAFSNFIYREMWNMNRNLFSFTLKGWVTLVGVTLCLFLYFFLHYPSLVSLAAVNEGSRRVVSRIGVLFPYWSFGFLLRGGILFP